MRRARPFGLALLAAVGSGCVAETAPPRPQLLIVVDTDAPVLGQANEDARFSPEAAVDTVRVDVLDTRDQPAVSREISATSVLDWPLSFAIQPPESGATGPARIRVRAFRARDATASVEQGRAALAPAIALTIDRVVEIPVPVSAAVDRRLVKLAADCFGRPASFRTRTSCLDATTRDSPFATLLPTAGAAVRSEVGTWADAREVPCRSAAVAGRVCIPGGVSVLGSEVLAGMEDPLTTPSSRPVRLARVAPFYLDVTELTVGRARRWLDRLTAPLTGRGSEMDFGQYCTRMDDPREDLPLNCITPEAAREICRLEGGELPTEAQWNHAATGRGQGRKYPWGERHGGCCNASTGRFLAGAGIRAVCAGEGPEPVGSHRGEDCAGLGDVSRDGVLDLGGSLSELLQDDPAPFDHGCWGDPFGILVEPSCKGADTGSDVGVRGGGWSAGQSAALAGLRRRSSLSVEGGFRCAYADGGR